MAWYSKPLGRRGKLPPATTRYVTVHRDLRVDTDDGITLLADLHQPRIEAPSGLPTLLVRSPYGRRGKWGAVYGQLFAERGYNVLIQSTRGTYGSEGLFEPMIHEAADGQATVRWMRDQAWFSGEFAVMGASYLAFAGWALAADPPAELRGLASHVGPHEWRSTIYPGGAFGLDFALSWTANRLRGDDPDSLVLNLLRSKPDVREQVARAFTDLPLAEVCAEVLGGRGPWLQQWLQHGPDDETWWAQYDASAALEEINVPVLLLGGWQDLFAHQTLHQYRTLTKRGVPVDLAIGPWTHRGLEEDWPAMVKRTLAWLEAVFHDGPAPGQEPDVYIGGADQWVRLPVWPPPGTRGQPWHLQPGQKLSAEPVAAGPPDLFTYDPAAPTPTVGGATMRADAGRQDSQDLEQRVDVLSYTSPPLDRDLEVHGEPTVTLRMSCSADSFDCFTRLCEVTADGVSTNVTDSIVRVAADRGAPAQVSLALAPTAHRFRQGSRLRLQVAGGSHPRFARNLGTGDPVGVGHRVVVSRIRVHHDAASPSTLVLPVHAGRSATGSTGTASDGVAAHHLATRAR